MSAFDPITAPIHNKAVPPIASRPVVQVTTMQIDATAFTHARSRQ